MRPLRLELRGFTSFREPAVVDFEGRRLFAITGPTGAGKSSLLDAITWALYGEAPRVGRATRQLITHGARSMAVQFDFSVRGERYRVSRQAPSSIGTRIERQRPDGAWEPLADRAREVGARVTELLGLDFATFTKTVLLPQGAFDEFLRGDEPQRRDILTRLLGLGRYEEAGSKARNRAAGAVEAARTLREQIERLDAATPEAIADLEREHAALAARVAAIEAHRALLEARV
ncbi:MAG: SMC family ATPase, partial [Chloroflexi bacterium]|nr:SMC family ATPase [Chloroflexota bacterium]